MLELISDLPDTVVGIRASGQVTAEDYESVLMPAIDARLAQRDRVRVLYHLGADFTGFTSGAMWDDIKLGLGHLKAWEKLAVVTDVGWVAHAVRLFGIAMPCPVKVFPNAEFAAARRCIGAE